MRFISCYTCEETINMDKNNYNISHIQSHFKGGSSNYENLCICCINCNQGMYIHNANIYKKFFNPFILSFEWSGKVPLNICRRVAEKHNRKCFCCKKQILSFVERNIVVKRTHVKNKCVPSINYMNFMCEQCQEPDYLNVRNLR